MGKVIQMIPTSETNSFFIIDVQEKQMTFRVTMNPNHLQKEPFIIKDNMVYCSFYNFHINYLNQFLNLKNDRT